MISSTDYRAAGQIDVSDANAVIRAFAEGVYADDDRIQASIDTNKPRVGVGIPPIFGAVFRANADVRGFLGQQIEGLLEGENLPPIEEPVVVDGADDDENERNRELIFDAVARLERAHLEAWVANAYCRQAGPDCPPMEKFDRLRGENKNFDLWSVDSGVIGSRSVFGNSIENFDYNAVFVPNHVAVTDLGGKAFVTHMFPVVLNCKLRDKGNVNEPAVTADMFPALPSGDCPVPERVREEFTAIGKTIGVDYTGLVATFNGINSLYMPDLPNSNVKMPYSVKLNYPNGISAVGSTLERSVKPGELVVTNYEANAIIIRAGLVRGGVLTEAQATVNVRCLQSMLDNINRGFSFTAGPPNNVKVLHVDDWYNIESGGVYALLAYTKPAHVYLHGTSNIVKAFRGGMRDGATRHPHVDGNVGE